MTEVYVVNAYRWGDRDDHSYTVGVFTSKSEAKKAADSHVAYRGGKYTCEVESVVLNGFDNDMDDYTKTIYTSPGLNNK